MMNLVNALLDSYEAAEKAGLVDNTLNDPTLPILLPIYHSSTRSNGKNIFEIVLSANGEILSGGFLPDLVQTVYPVTEDSMSKASGAVSRPLVEEVSYLDPITGDKKDGLYLIALNDWLQFETDVEIKRYLNLIFEFVSNNSIGILISKLIAKGSKFDYDANKYKLEVYSDEEKDSKPDVFDLAKVMVTFKIMGFVDDTDYTVTNYKALHEAHIKHITHINNNKPQKCCNLTGELSYCSIKHRGMMGNARIISAGTDSSNLETYFGRFSSRSQVINISNEASNKIHNMIKYLLENHNTATRLSFKTGASGEDPAVLCVWFSDDVTNKRHANVMNPQETVEDAFESIMTDDDDEDKYMIGGIATQNLAKSAKGFRREINRNAKVYIMILDKVSMGRISIKYFKSLTQGEFYDNLKKWYEGFSWYFYDTEKKEYVRRSPSLPRIVDVLFGNEFASEGRAVVKMADSKNKYKESLMTSLLPCVIDGKPLPLSFHQRAFRNMKTRNRFSSSWGNVLGVSCAALSKYREDRKGERMDDKLIDESKQTPSYLYGRILAVLEKAEIDAMADDDSANRATNAERFWNSYTKAPAKTLKLLINKSRPYWNRLKRAKPGLYFTHQKEIEQCVNLIEKSSGDASNKPLDEDFIFGYYAQRKKHFTKKEDKDFVEKKVEV